MVEVNIIKIYSLPSYKIKFLVEASEDYDGNAHALLSTNVSVRLKFKLCV